MLTKLPRLMQPQVDHQRDQVARPVARLRPRLVEPPAIDRAVLDHHRVGLAGVLDLAAADPAPAHEDVRRRLDVVELGHDPRSPRSIACVHATIAPPKKNPTSALTTAT